MGGISVGGILVIVGIVLADLLEPVGGRHHRPHRADRLRRLRPRQVVLSHGSATASVGTRASGALPRGYSRSAVKAQSLVAPDAACARAASSARRRRRAGPAPRRGGSAAAGRAPARSRRPRSARRRAPPRTRGARRPRPGGRGRRRRAPRRQSTNAASIRVRRDSGGFHVRHGAPSRWWWTATILSAPGPAASPARVGRARAAPRRSLPTGAATGARSSARRRSARRERVDRLASRPLPVELAPRAREARRRPAGDVVVPRDHDQRRARSRAATRPRARAGRAVRGASGRR